MKGSTPVALSKTRIAHTSKPKEHRSRRIIVIIIVHYHPVHEDIGVSLRARIQNIRRNSQRTKIFSREDVSSTLRTERIQATTTTTKKQPNH